MSFLTKDLLYRFIFHDKSELKEEQNLFHTSAASMLTYLFSVKMTEEKVKNDMLKISI